MGSPTNVITEGCDWDSNQIFWKSHLSHLPRQGLNLSLSAPACSVGHGGPSYPKCKGCAS